MNARRIRSLPALVLARLTRGAVPIDGILWPDRTRSSRSDSRAERGCEAVPAEPVRYAAWR